MKLTKYLVIASALLLNVSCNQDGGCDSGQGKYITCYKLDGTENGNWCTDWSIPPCECYTQDGKTYLLEEFKNKDKCNGDDLFKPPYAREPYKAGCFTPSATSLCIDFASKDLNTGSYFDYVEGSYDESYRPLYVSFSISAEDYDKKEGVNYAIQILDENNRTFVTQYINERNSNLRNFDNSCEACNVTGVMKLDIKYLPMESKEPVAKLISEEEIDNERVLTVLAEKSFKKFNEEIFTQSKKREMKIAITKTNEYNISEYYTDGGLSLSGAIAKALGSNAANIRTTIKEPEFYPQHIDTENSAAVLDVNFFTDLNKIDGFEMKRAVDSWCTSAYRKAFPEINNTGGVKYINSVFTGEISFFGIYQIYDEDTPPAEIVSPQTIKEKSPEGVRARAFGVTYSFDSRYIVSLVQRLSNPTDYLSNTVEVIPTQNSLALSTYLHELGHAWSVKGTDLDAFNPEDDCYGHTNKCSGKDKDICLWRTACVPTKTTEFDELLLAKSRNPIFCERHQYIFSNGLTVRN